MKLLNVDSEMILIESSHCLSSIFLSIKQKRDVASVGRDSLAPLVVLANSSVLEVAEQATRALAKLLLDSEVSEQAYPEEIILPVTRLLRDGSIDGRTDAAAAIARLLHCRPVDHVLSDIVNCAGMAKDQNRNCETDSNRSVIFGETLAVWLLTVISCPDNKSKVAIMEAGAVEVLTDKISQYLFPATRSDSKEDSSTWVCALLLAVLFQDRYHSGTCNHVIHSHAS